MTSFKTLFSLAGVLTFVLGTAEAENLLLRQGDHIAIVGNGLADRFQHDGWVETLLQAQFPDRQLVIRNLGFAGDELTTQMRCDNFGSADDWLIRTRADVVLAFFGYNESFAGPAGVGKFKQDLANFIRNLGQHKYNSNTPPRLVLFSPIGHENLHDPNLPDGASNNPNLKLYSEAMGEVAKQNGVLFADLYTPSLELYAQASTPLTIDGVHLSERGNQELAPVILRCLFPGHVMAPKDAAALAKIRAAVLDKNFYWFNRYRTVDGYNVYGGRSQMKYVDDISNWDVLQREMAALDVMTANRDERIWAVAQGKDTKVDDSNTPPFLAVKSNKPGPGAHGEHSFLDPQEAIGHMKLAPGLKVNLFASEKEYPDLAKPVQMAWDPQGRLWVAVWPSYPHWKPKDEMDDKLLVLEDTDGDGKADKCRVFADHLHCPTGFEFYNGGVLVAQAPDLIFLKDSRGTGRPDIIERVLNGIGSADTHHTANSFVLDPGGALYFQEGVFHTTQVETPYGPPARNANAGVYRYEPKTHKFEVYVSYDFANPHGHVFDRWGEDFVMDGTGAEPYVGVCFSGRTYFPQRHKRAPKLYEQRTRPCPGMDFLSSRQFPDDMQGNLLVANVIGFLGILQYQIVDKDSGFVGKEVTPFVQSDDPNFRPVDIKVGPDGAVYFLEWQNPIIGHLQHHLRDPSRDHIHGRIYRVTCPERPLLRPATIAGESIPKLLELLRQPEDRVRYRARIELSGRDSKEVIAAVDDWKARLDSKDPDYEHHLMEALWVHQFHNSVDETLLKRMLRSPDFHARAAATRVLCYWRDRVQDPLALLKVQANDDHPRVRLEAVRACSFFATPRAAEVALEALSHPMDTYLKYTLDETMNTLDRFTKQARE
jgi:glucose/arabinose dehydrogenase/lysophospholipase L1-like esterase